MQKGAVLHAVQSAIEDFNATQETSRHLGTAPSTPIFGPDSGLDSLGLVNLILEIEGRVQEDLDLTIALVSPKAMARKRSPFRTVDSICNQILRLEAAQSA